MRSALSSTSGRSDGGPPAQISRIEHGGDEAASSDICAGGGGGGGGGMGAPLAGVAGGGEAVGDGAAAAAAVDEEMEEDGEMSYYDGNARVQEVEDTFSNIPTPLPQTAPAVEGGDEVEVTGPGGVIIRSQRSNSSEGWVDQYTNSSIGGSRDDLAGATQQAPPATS